MATGLLVSGKACLKVSAEFFHQEEFDAVSVVRMVENRSSNRGGSKHRGGDGCGRCGIRHGGIESDEPIGLIRDSHAEFRPAFASNGDTVLLTWSGFPPEVDAG